jgi:hypothetical protein
MLEQTEDGLYLATGNGHLFFNPEIAEMAEVAAYLESQMALGYLTTATATAMLANITSTGLFVGLLTGASYAAATEIVAGTAYTAVSGGRPPVTWSAFATDHQTSSSTQTFAMLVAQTSGIPYFGIYSTNTTSTLLCGGPTTGLTGSIPIGANVTFTSSITLTVAG